MDYISITNNSNEDNKEKDNNDNNYNYNNDDSDDDNDDDQVNMKQTKPILKVSSLSQLNTSTGLHIGFLTASELIQSLHYQFQTSSSNILTIFCGNSVHDSLHYFALNHSIILVRFSFHPHYHNYHLFYLLRPL